MNRHRAVFLIPLLALSLTGQGPARKTAAAGTLSTLSWGTRDASITSVEAADGGGAFVALEAAALDPQDAAATRFFITRFDDRGRVPWKIEIVSSDATGLKLLAAADGGCWVGLGNRGAIVKLSAEGGTVWARRLESPAGAFRDPLYLARAPGGDIFAAGRLFDAAGKSLLLTARLNEDGDVVWCRSFSPTSWWRIDAISRSSDGGLRLGGAFEYDPRRFWIFALDGAGETLWQKTYRCESPLDSFGLEHLLPREDGGTLLAVGFRSSGYDREGGAVRLTSAGEVVWGGRLGGDGVLCRRAADNDGDRLVTRTGGLLWLGPDGRVLSATMIHPIVTASAVPAAGSGYFMISFLRNGELSMFIKTDNAGASDSCRIQSGASTASAPESILAEDIDLRGDASVLSASPAEAEVRNSALFWTPFCRDPYSVLLRIAGAEGGMTSPSPGETSYPRGETAAVEAVPSDNYDFLDWSGDIPDPQRRAARISLIMDGDKAIQPRFAAIEVPANFKGARLTPGFRPVSIIMLTWDPSPGEAPAVKYRIYEAGESGETLVAEVPASVRRFVQRRASREAAAEFAVCAVSASEREGVRARVVVR